MAGVGRIYAELSELPAILTTRRGRWIIKLAFSDSKRALKFFEKTAENRHFVRDFAA